VFLLDSLLVGGLRFVLDKVATVVDAELNDETALRTRLMEASEQLDAGELSQDEFDALEADVFARLREIRQNRGEAAGIAGTDGVTVTGIEASIEGDEH
jgi:hypothetical protein